MRAVQNGARLGRAMGRALVALVLVLVVAPALAESAVEDASRTAARDHVAKTVDLVLSVLKDPALTGEQKRERVEQLAYERFDFRTISRLVLARNWSRLTPEQREAFSEEFKRHLSLTYGGSVDRYRDETVEVGKTRLERNGDVTVRTRITGASAEPVLVDYRLRSRDDSWGIIDVIIEGVSLLQNFRTQTQELISSEGPQGLIEKLRAKNAARDASSG